MEEFLVLEDAARAAHLRMEGITHARGWDVAESDEPLIHRIHSYPAKFPGLVPTKAFQIAAQMGIRVRRVGDVFCGCGTVALESRREGYEFWGCDVNPVAALIARAKSAECSPRTLRARAAQIAHALPGSSADPKLDAEAQRRLQRWFTPSQFDDLARLKNAIEVATAPTSAYRDVLLCAFSAILKSVSQWRTRSHKPALDLEKYSPNVSITFLRQCELFARAWEERAECAGPAGKIVVASALDAKLPESIDLLVTSPPYVTSYEYADLHQLSILWLGYASDHRELRREMIGSAAGAASFASDFQRLNSTGVHTAFSLYGRNRKTAERVVRYYLDMQEVAKRAHTMMSKRSLAVFLIGNAEVHGVKLDNATHLAESLLNAGFTRVRAAMRRLSNKANTPFRTVDGRLSRGPASMVVYPHEYVLLAEK